MKGVGLMTKIYGVKIYSDFGFGKLDDDVKEALNKFLGKMYFKTEKERKEYVKEYYNTMEKFMPSYDRNKIIFTDWATWQVEIILKEFEEEIKQVRMR